MDTALKKFKLRAEALSDTILKELTKVQLSLGTLLKNFLRKHFAPSCAVETFDRLFLESQELQKLPQHRAFQYAVRSAIQTVELTLACLESSRWTAASMEKSAEVGKLRVLIDRLKDLQDELDQVLMQIDSPASNAALKSSQAACYQIWTSHARRRMKIERAPRLQPKFSIILPVYNPPLSFLTQALESVIQQDYPNWELCISDDASTQPGIKELLQSYAARDERIKLVFREKNGHISASTNSALELATGDFVGFFDHDDQLAEGALSVLAHTISKYPEAKLFYSDEDKMDENGLRHTPYFKPDWSLEMLRAQNYLCHLCVYERSLIEKAGGLRLGFEGSQDWDLALRVVETLEPSQIVHIPEILYHWRIFAGSAALAVTEKSYTVTAAKKALEEHLLRTQTSAVLEPVTGFNWRVKFTLPANPPLVSIIIPTRNKLNYVKRCLDSIMNLTSYEPFEILLVDNESDDPECVAWMNQVSAQNAKVRVLKYEKPFNYSAVNNFAVAQAKGEILLFLNNDTEVLHPEWLEEMVVQALRPEVGCVGALLLYPNDTIQHAGVLLGVGSVAGHAFLHHKANSSGYLNRLRFVSEYDAVTAACLAVRKTLFDSVGGFNEQDLPIAFNDVDLCLKISEAGYHNLFTPFARLYHYESVSRGRELCPTEKDRSKREVDYMQSRWAKRIELSKFYSPHLSLEGNHTFQIASPPREVKPIYEV